MMTRMKQFVPLFFVFFYIEYVRVKQEVEVLVIEGRCLLFSKFF